MGWTRARACPASERSSNGRWLPFITATVKARAGIRSTRIPLRGFAEVHEDAPVGSLLSWLRKKPCACGRLDRVDFDEIGRNDTRTTRSRIVGRTIVSGKRRRWSNGVDSLLDGRFLIKWFSMRSMLRENWLVLASLTAFGGDCRDFFRISYSTISLVVINVCYVCRRKFWSRLVGMLSLIVFVKGFSRIRDAILFEDYVLLLKARSLVMIDGD